MSNVPTIIGTQSLINGGSNVNSVALTTTDLAPIGNTIFLAALLNASNAPTFGIADDGVGGSNTYTVDEVIASGTFTMLLARAPVTNRLNIGGTITITASGSNNLSDAELVAAQHPGIVSALWDGTADPQASTALSEGPVSATPTSMHLILGVFGTENGTAVDTFIPTGPFTALTGSSGGRSGFFLTLMWEWFEIRFTSVHTPEGTVDHTPTVGFGIAASYKVVTAVNETRELQEEALVDVAGSVDLRIESRIQAQRTAVTLLENLIGPARTSALPLETRLEVVQTVNVALEANRAASRTAQMPVEASSYPTLASSMPVEGNGNHVAQTAVVPTEARVGIHGLNNVWLELIVLLPFTAQARIEALRRAKLSPTLGFEGDLAVPMMAQLAIERQLRATRTAALPAEAPGGSKTARAAGFESRGFIFSAISLYLESKLSLAVARLFHLERQLRASGPVAIPLENSRSAAPVNVVATARINIERRKFKGWHIEANNRVVQTATLVTEARGLIVPAVNTINVENGDNQGRFGIIRRLSNKSTLRIAQRPTEGG